jgi:hypothetical protein
MPGSQTTPVRTRTRDNARVRMAFRFRNSVGNREGGSFAAQWLAYALPYRRFVCILADTHTRLGANVVRYSFIAMDLHHLLLAGLYRRTPENRSSPRTDHRNRPWLHALKDRALTLRVMPFEQVGADLVRDCRHLSRTRSAPTRCQLRFLSSCFGVAVAMSVSSYRLYHARAQKGVALCESDTRAPRKTVASGPSARRSERCDRDISSR